MRSERTEPRTRKRVTDPDAASVQLADRPMELKLEELSTLAFEHGVSTQ